MKTHRWVTRQHRQSPRRSARPAWPRRLAVASGLIVVLVASTVATGDGAFGMDPVGDPSASSGPLANRSAGVDSSGTGVVAGGAIGEDLVAAPPPPPDLLARAAPTKPSPTLTPTPKPTPGAASPRPGTPKPSTPRPTGSAPTGSAPTGPAPTTAAPPPTTTAPLVIDFPNFADISALALNGSAGQSGTALRLTPGYDVEAGSAWLRTPMDVTRSFSTTFRMWLHNDGGEGLAFVLQREGLGALGEARGALGYGDVGGTANRVNPSVAVEFDVNDNSWDPYTGDNHVAIVLDGQMEQHLDVGVPSFDLWCDCVVTAWITYDAGTKRLSVYTSTGTTRPTTPIVVATVDLAATLGAGSGYVGFTASNGYYIERQDIISWRLTQ